MLHGQLLNRLLIAATAAAAVALAAPGVDAARADAAQVRVLSPGGAEQTLSLDVLAGGEDVREGSYVLRASSGESSQVVSGFSLAALLEAAGADPYSFSYLEVLRPAGGAVLLSRNQALGEGAFPDGPPVVYATSAGTGFLRPSSGPEDLNASDSFEAPQGVTIALRKGSPLEVRAEASTLRTRPGKPVEFTAAVDRAGAGEELTYSWYFDDGASASGPSATHSFARPGSYDVVVGVTTPGDDTGVSAVVTIQVGAPPEGPDRKGGGTSRDAEAPDHGAAAGNPAGGSPTAPVAPTSPAPSPPEQEPQPRPEPKPREVPQGELVTGELLSATTPTPPEPKASPAARRGNLDGEESGGPGLPGAALGLLVTAGLLGAGALTEARSLLR
ncbi:MAG TPA: PKD domain-containing protein [Solirubrobacterales bacterium]|nr:PKD domain-containing protein [Solirubrobacterales bacterium]